MIKPKTVKVTEEERRKRLILALRCAKRHVKTRKDRTTREIELLALAAVGYTDPAIAERLNIDASTVSAYWKRVLERFGARTRTEAVAAFLMLEVLRLREQIAETRGDPTRE